MNKRFGQSMLQLGLVVGIAIFANVLGSAFFTHVDLTEENRFTLTPATERMLDSLSDVVYVEVLLDGEDFPAGFKRLQRAVKEMLDDFRSQSGGRVEYTFTDPSTGTTESINQRREEYAKSGIQPTNLRIDEVDGTSEKLIYPYALVRYQARTALVDLLDEDAPGAPEEQLNHSISQLEFNFANAFYRLQKGIKPIIAFTIGHGELAENQRVDLVKNLRSYYDVGVFNLDSASFVPIDIEALIVAKPTLRFNDRHQFLLDQYVMNGGKVIWLIDRLNVELDSLSLAGNYIPRDLDLDLDGILFKYGARINPDLVLDLQSTRIPMIIDPTGKQELFKWPYSPIIFPKTDHVMVKSLDGIEMRFPSSIDTVKTKTDVKKTVLLSTSDYGRTQPNITRLNFEILRYDPDPAKYNKPNIPVAVLLEGVFPSFFENKITEEFKAELADKKRNFRDLSVPTKMLVVADGDIARNGTDPNTGAPRPLGFNIFERHKFANKDFLLNAVEYLTDDSGIIEARNKEVKLRMLDGKRAKSGGTGWRLLNIGLPLVLLAVFGVAYNWVRRRRFA